MRLVDADELCRTLKKEQEENGDVITTEGIDIAWKYVKDAPTIAPVRQGEWLPFCDGEGLKCSVCRYMHFDEPYNYCPHCGAKMK